jgi:LytR cell envelope-related transcriptional attenuator
VSAPGPASGQNGDMSRPPGGSREFARGASAAALKGAGLIGLAVIVGVFLLQRVDTTKASSSTTPVKPPKTTTTLHKTNSTTTTTTTVPSAPAKTPDQLRVLVLNGGAATGAAANLRTKLQRVGYTNQPPASTWTGHRQRGTTLMCRAGLDREKVALSQQTALQGAKVVAFPTPAPPFSDGVDCVVVAGS